MIVPFFVMIGVISNMLYADTSMVVAAKSSQKLRAQKISTPVQATRGERPEKMLLAEIPCMKDPVDQVEDRLFAWYIATPKLDSWDRKKNAEKDFSDKDPKAAAHAKMTLKQFVVGGADPVFKQKLYCLMLGLEQASKLRPELSPGITRIFADRFRQHIAEGTRSCDSCTYHGSRPELGYGRGIAADIVGRGATREERLQNNEKVWAWIDEHGKEYGLGRPYPYGDPVHIGLISGGECRAHNDCDPTKIAKHKNKKKKVSMKHRKKKYKRARK